MDLYGISQKVLGVALDNASPNNTMMVHLDKTMFPHFSSRYRVRCFLHILNLVAKSLLEQFDVKKKKVMFDDGEEVEGWFLDQEDPKLQKILKEFDRLREPYDAAEPVDGEDIEVDEEEDLTITPRNGLTKLRSYRQKNLQT